jgi:hypothetical protein
MSGFDIRWDAERQEWFAFDGDRIISCKSRRGLERLLRSVEMHREAKGAVDWEVKLWALKRAVYAAGLEVYACSVCGCAMVASPTGKEPNVCVECRGNTERET